MSENSLRVSRSLSVVFFSFLIFVCLSVWRPCPSYAQDIGAPLITEALSAAVCDQTGTILWSKDAETPLEPASITKVMTAMVALDSGKQLSDICQIHEVDLGGESQAVGYVAADSPTFRELLLAMLVFSGNDAATNVALNVCGSLDEFIARMNDKALSLGMHNTHFANVHGLEEDGHLSCASDLVAMGRYAMEHYPFIARAVVMPSVTVTAGGQTFTLDSTDELVGNYPGMLGIKTGAVHTGTAFLGACHRSGITLYTCVLGCETLDGRFSDTIALLDWAYATFRKRDFAREGWALRICGFADNFALKCLVCVPADGVTGLVWPAGERISYRNTMSRRNTLVLPGQAYGAATWRQNGRLVSGVCWQVEPALYRLPAGAELSYSFLSAWTSHSVPSIRTVSV